MSDEDAFEKARNCIYDKTPEMQLHEHARKVERRRQKADKRQEKKDLENLLKEVQVMKNDLEEREIVIQQRLKELDRMEQNRNVEDDESDYRYDDDGDDEIF